MNSTWKYLSKFDSAVQSLCDSNEISSGARGKFRQELKFSEKKYRAIKRGERLEDALEKTTVFLLDKSEKKGVTWFNQFNIASGAGGEKKESIDFGCFKDDPKLKTRQLDLFELKQWNKSDSLLRMHEELTRYSSQLAVLNSKNVPPFDAWPRRINVTLWCVAPHDFFDGLGGIGKVNKDLSILAKEFDKEKRGTLLSNFEFSRKVISFNKRLTKELFVSFFDRSKKSAESPGEVLSKEHQKELTLMIEEPIRKAISSHRS